MPEKLSPEDKATIQAILDRAAVDIEFREALLRDPQVVLDPKRQAPQKLSDNAMTVLFSMRRVALEEMGINVRASRAFLRDNGHSSSRAE
jgi:hypothetical protein